MKRTVESNGYCMYIPVPKRRRSPRRTKTLLDDLVIENCVSQLHYIERVFFEQVSRRLANILRLSYKSTAISLEIHSYGKFKNRYIFTDPGRIEKDDEMQRVGFEFYEVKLKSAIHLIFSRYKRVRCLQINTENIKTFTENYLAIAADERCRPIEMQRLTFSLNFCTEIDSRLIVQFSPLLMSLKLDCPLPRDMDISKELWLAVGQCSKLDRLSICSLNSYLFNVTDECWTHMQDCLRKLKIRILHSGMGAKSFSADWLAGALLDNDRLQILSLDDHYEHLETFSDPVLAPVVSRLRTVTIDFGADEEMEDYEEEILAILGVLPMTGYLTVSQTMDVVGENNEKIPVVPEKIVQILRFWLKTSNQTGKAIKLDFVYHNDALRNTNRGIMLMSKTKELEGFILEQKNNHTIVRHKAATIILSISGIDDDKPTKIWKLPKST